MKNRTAGFTKLNEIKEIWEQMHDKSKDINLGTITKALDSYFKDRNEDKEVKPDIDIQEDGDTFSVGISNRLRTGRGGLKMYLEHFGDLDMHKVSYNGIILNSEQKQELFNKIKND